MYLRAMLVALAVVCLTAFVAFVALKKQLERESTTVIYATRADAEADGAFRRGWLPDFVSPSAQAIVEAHNLDTNEVCARFQIDPADAETLVARLATEGFAAAQQPPRPPRRFSAIHPCPFGEKEIGAASRVLRSAAARVAISSDNRTVYYWSGHEPDA